MLFTNILLSLVSLTALIELRITVHGARSIYPPSPSRNFNLTAITAAGGRSTLQCWRMNAKFDVSNSPGIANGSVLQLGEQVSSASFTIIPPRSDGGLHNPSAPMFVHFFSGLVHITLPGSADDAWIQGGKQGLLFAMDTNELSSKGHGATYPGNEQTGTLSVLTARGSIPEHSIIHSGACSPEELQF